LGRDLLSRIIFGARVSVIVGLGASVVASVVEISVGVLAGYIGGTFDLVVQRFVDAVMCFPGLILMMVIISLVARCNANNSGVGNNMGNYGFAANKKCDHEY